MALDTTAEADQSLMVLFQQLIINPRFPVESFQVSGRGEFHQVFPTCAVFCQQKQMINGTVFAVKIFPRSKRDPLVRYSSLPIIGLIFSSQQYDKNRWHRRDYHDP